MMRALVSGLLVFSTAAEANVFELIGDRDYDLPPLEEFQAQIELGGFKLDRPQGIVNGTRTSDYNNVVVLMAFDRWGGFMFCSGSQIDDEWFLTAGHCLDGADEMIAQRYDLYIGWGGDSDNLTDSREWKQHIIHPEYDDRWLWHDVGLVETLDPKTGINPMILNDEEVNNGWEGMELTFAGYGDTYDNANDAGLKRITDIPIDRVTFQHIYAYHPDTNVCQGDSGGPAMELNGDGQWEVVGVNSFVSPGCVGGEAGAARVDTHIDWIMGYVPDAKVGPYEPVDEVTEPTDTETDTDPGTTGGNGTEPDPDTSSPDGWGEEWEAPTTPSKGSYPTGVRCQTGPTGSVAQLGWLAFIGVLARRRRHADNS